MKKILSTTLATLCFSPVSYAQKQSWTYQAYIQSSGTRSAPGYIEITQQNEKAELRLVAGNNLDICYRNSIPATVNKTDKELIITAKPTLYGCQELRFVINLDGSGGKRETKQGEQWVWDGLDRNLKPRN